MKRLPFFVYGTLLPGQPNDHYWENDVSHSTPAIFHNAILYSFFDFPMMIEKIEPKSQVIGILNWIKPDGYQRVLNELDFLEHYNPADVENSMYRRVERKVTSGDGSEIIAWVYVGQPVLVKGLPLIPEGNWQKYAENINDFSNKSPW